MFMRLVQVRVKEGFLPAVTRLYARSILPALASVAGCRYGGLLQSVQHTDECLSLTLWNSEGDVNAYEESGLFTTLLDQTRPFQAESSELRLQLTDDLKLEYVPVPDTPVVGSYPVAASDAPGPDENLRPRALWVRVVSLKIRPGKREEFKSLYADRVIPVLRKLPGCAYVYLLEKADAPNEVLSITGWDSKENADRYERGGTFDQLLDSQQGLLSELYTSKRERRNEDSGAMVTSDDVTVECYSVIVEESFGGQATDPAREDH
jgi:heme-degrading monooxygenase HmoA